MKYAHDLISKLRSIERNVVDSGFGPIALGILSILSVIGAYEALRFIWSGHESLIIGIILLSLPGTSIGFALSGVALGISEIREEGKKRVLGVSGLLVSLLTFVLCGLLMLFFCVGSGGLMGF